MNGNIRIGVNRRRSAIVIVSLLVSFVAVPSAALGSNADAARACQVGGYSSLQGTNGTTFKNAGECVSFVARGGTITGVTTNCAFTAGISGCVEFDNVVVYMGGLPTGSWTSVSGMFSFAPVTSWDTSTTVVVSGSGTWSTSTNASGTWAATGRSSIYLTTFFDEVSSSFGLCSAATVRYVGVHLDIAGDGVAAGSVFELGLRNATSGTNYVQYQGFSTVNTGEPIGLHNTTDVSGVTVRC